MIVRDGVADGVDVAIASARPHVDEVCIYDAGSTDGTLELLDALASEPGAPIRVERGAWTDDFSWARNESAAMASSDWLLWLDANDELIGGENVREVVSRADAAHADIAWLYWDRYDRKGQLGWWPSLVRAGTGQWQGVVHECWRRPGIDRWRHGIGQPGSVHVHPGAARIFHRDRTEKPFKYLRLLVEATKDPARTPWALVALADEITSVDPKHALELYERHLREGWDDCEGEPNFYRALTLKQLSARYAQQGDEAKARRYMAQHDSRMKQLFADIGHEASVFVFNELGNEALVKTWAATKPSKINDVLLKAPAPIAPTTKVGRNDPCPCGSGRKSKKCCAT